MIFMEKLFIFLYKIYNIRNMNKIYNNYNYILSQYRNKINNILSGQEHNIKTYSEYSKS